VQALHGAPGVQAGPVEPVQASRRRIVLGAGAAGALLAMAPALAQQPAQRVKGPRVWLDMDQAELDDAYDQSVYAPNQRQVTGRYATNSEAVRARLGTPRRFAYGPTPAEGLDVYTTQRANAPVNVFIHGGAWRVGAARDYAFPAELFVQAGAHFVVPDFAPVQELGGDLMAMAGQVRRAVAWVHRNAKTFGGDPGRIYVSGHSSGAHLAGVVLITDWRKDFDLPPDTVKGGLCCSGMFDLKPVRLSARSRYVKFTDEMEDALSAQRHLDRLNTPLILAHGTFETPEFQRQSRDFAAAAKAAGKPVQLLVAQGYNHFEIIETLASPYGLLGRAVLEQMGKHFPI
jgi:arylformamidase